MIQTRPKSFGLLEWHLPVTAVLFDAEPTMDKWWLQSTKKDPNEYYRMIIDLDAYNDRVKFTLTDCIRIPRVVGLVGVYGGVLIIRPYPASSTGTPLGRGETVNVEWMVETYYSAASDYGR